MAITYCLVCNITGEKYYGSSTKTLETRLNSHISKYNTCVSRQIIERGDYDIYQLGEYETELEAKMKEKWYINNKECINKNNVLVTDEEIKQYHKQYRENNKEEIKQYAKQYSKKYCENNKEEKKQYDKQYYENNKEKKKEYYEKNRERVKEYREKNREKIREREKKYRENNREKNREEISEKNKEYQKEYYLKNREKYRGEKVQCEFCGIEMLKKSIRKHQKSFHLYAIFTDKDSC
mgnify:CR=1 FL=1